MSRACADGAVSIQTGTTVNVKQAVPFFNVKDMPNSLRFYVDRLGFTLKNQWTPDGNIRWRWLEIGNAALMLQDFWGEDGKAHIPVEKLGVGTSVCFMCNDAIALYHEFKSRGVNAKRPFVGNGLWVTCVEDPDGYKLFFESQANAPEETEYQASNGETRS